MRLLVVSAGDFFSTYGGGQVYLKNLVDQLIDIGVDLVILSPGKTDCSTGSYRSSKVIYYDPDADSSGSTLRAVFDEVKPDVVHAHGMKSIIAELCHALGVPCIVTAHHGGILCPAGALLNRRDAICRIKASSRACLPCVLNNIRWGGNALFLLDMISFERRLQIAHRLRRLPFVPYLTPVGTATLVIEEKISEWNSICRYATLLIAPSRAIAESMVLNGAPSDNIAIVPHGIAAPEVVRSKTNDASADSALPLKFFFVGRISHVKGVHILLKSLSCISGENPVELHVVGGAETKSEKRYLQELRKRYYYDDRIIWHGKKNHADMNKLIQLFDVLVHPAICLEVYGLTIAEALLMQKPVIATRCGGPEDQIREGVNGLLVEPNDPGALADAMAALVRNRDLVSAMSARAAGDVVTMSVHLFELMHLYQICRKKS